MDGGTLALGENQIGISHAFTRVELSEIVLIINWNVYQRTASAKPEIDFAQLHIQQATA